MKPLLNRCIVASLHRFCDSTIQRFNALPVLLSAALFLPAVARAQSPLPDAAATRSSASGQFTVIGAKLAVRRPPPGTPSPTPNWSGSNPRCWPFPPSASRNRSGASWALTPLTPWRGRIFLALHPAASPDENVTIISTRFAGVWNYRVELPDVLSRTRLTRALTGAVLLELANRDNSGDRSAEIPAWLTEGLSQQLLAAGNRK